LNRTVSEMWETVTREEYVKYYLLSKKYPHLFVGTTL